MATYGVDLRTGNPHNGLIGFSGWTPTLGLGQPIYGSGNTNGAVQFNGQTQSDNKIAQAFRKNSPALKFARAVFASLLGVAGGTAPIVQYAQVRGQLGDKYTSLRAIDLVTVPGSGRAKNTNDVNAFAGMINRTVFPATYVKDVGGNGGGGKVRF